MSSSRNETSLLLHSEEEKKNYIRFEEIMPSYSVMTTRFYAKIIVLEFLLLCTLLLVIKLCGGIDWVAFFYSLATGALIVFMLGLYCIVVDTLPHDRELHVIFDNGIIQVRRIKSQTLVFSFPIEDVNMQYSRIQYARVYAKLPPVWGKLDTSSYYRGDERCILLSSPKDAKGQKIPVGYSEQALAFWSDVFNNVKER